MKKSHFNLTNVHMLLTFSPFVRESTFDAIIALTLAYQPQ